ncbi:MAG TPA: PHB depolymerase family esterase, partial [Acidimicrobiia bacterium]|nr:PHB depolymerase family esterase [Acidimicrobiia bacterium]
MVVDSLLNGGRIVNLVSSFQRMGAVLALLLLTACAAGVTEATGQSSTTSGAPDQASTVTSAPDRTTTTGSADAQLEGNRPASIDVPAGYDPAVPVPLLVVLASFGTPGAEELTYTGLGDLVAEEGILVVAPDGSLNDDGEHFWNATDACCADVGSDVDDVAYLGSLIEEISAEWNVDPARVFAFGHSNGGFMAYRLACDRADLGAAVVSVAGVTWSDPTACDPSHAVSVLQIHGTDDEVVRYEGGRFAVPYPGGMETVAAWATYDSCTGGLVTDPAQIDIDENVAGI